MQTLARIAVIAIFLMCFPVSSSWADSGGGDLDLGKTRQLLHSWVLRDSFPDSPSLAYYYVQSFRILGEEITADKRDRMIAFIKRCQRNTGGFVSSPEHGEEANVVYTYYALAALELLGAGDAIDKAGAGRFVRGLIEPGGGLRATRGDATSPTLASTFFGVESLRILGELSALDQARTTAFIMTHQVGDPGEFGVTPQGAPRPRAVSMAVQALETLGTLPKAVRSGAIAYFEEAIALVGTRGPQFRAFSTTQAVTDIVVALDRLRVLDEVITDRIVAFVKDRYIPQNGGFGPAPGLGTTPTSTYQALLCLDKLGALAEAPGS